jgi:hypothetical protein
VRRVRNCYRLRVCNDLKEEPAGSGRLGYGVNVQPVCSPRRLARCLQSTPPAPDSQSEQDWTSPSPCQCSGQPPGRARERRSATSSQAQRQCTGHIRSRHSEYAGQSSPGYAAVRGSAGESLKMKLSSFSVGLGLGLPGRADSDSIASESFDLLDYESLNGVLREYEWSWMHSKQSVVTEPGSNHRVITDCLSAGRGGRGRSSILTTTCAMMYSSHEKCTGDEKCTGVPVDSQYLKLS